MIYTAISRELQNRLNFHAAPGRMLEGITVAKSGQFRVDGEQDMPQVGLVDMEVDSSKPGTEAVTVSMFVKTAARWGWTTDATNGTKGLMSWVELVMDALETAPSDGKVDLRLRLHRDDGALLSSENWAAGTELLTDIFTITGKMAEITNVKLLYQIDFLARIPTGRRGNRRNFIPASAYL